MTAYYLVNEAQILLLQQYNSGNNAVVIVGTPAGSAISEETLSIGNVAEIVADSKIIYLDDNGTWSNIPVNEVPTWRIRAILAIMGLENDVNDAIESLPEPDKTIAERAWSYGSSSERTSSIISYIQNVLNLTNEQVDSIFIQASQIPT